MNENENQPQMIGSDDQPVVLLAIATDNLPNRSGMRIPAKELVLIARYLVGRLAIKDHSMWSIDASWGRITEAWVKQLPTPKGLGKDEKESIAGEGYQQVQCYIQAPPDQPILSAIAADIAGEASITFSYSQLKCPGCDCKADIYPSWGCPRSISAQPYLERHGVRDAYEISLVVVPAVKVARIVLSK